MFWKATRRHVRFRLQRADVYDLSTQNLGPIGGKFYYLPPRASFVLPAGWNPPRELHAEVNRFIFQQWMMDRNVTQTLKRARCDVVT
jgi:hypothetical protein